MALTAKPSELLAVAASELKGKPADGKAEVLR